MMTGGLVDVERVCPVCGKHFVVTVDSEGFMNWKSGMLIQDALPDMTPDEREVLISGMCVDCQKMFFD